MKVHLTTLGCPKNQVDSELMLGMLARAGFPLAERPEDAECLVVNTCAFIDRAREESVATILELARLKETGACRTLIVTGCLTQRYGPPILPRLPPRRDAAAAPDAAGALRLREDRRGLRHGLHLLRHPPVPRPPPEPPARRRRPRGRGAGRARHPGGDPGLAGHARVRARPAGRGRRHGPARGARRDAHAVDPPDVPAPRARDRPADRALGARARRALPPPAGAARRRRGAARDAARRQRAAHAGDRP